MSDPFDVTMPDSSVDQFISPMEEEGAEVWADLESAAGEEAQQDLNPGVQAEMTPEEEAAMAEQGGGMPSNAPPAPTVPSPDSLSPDAPMPEPQAPEDDWSGVPTTAGYPANWSYGDPTGYGKYVEEKMEEYGWGPEQLPALIALWNETSSHLTQAHNGQIAWDPDAFNPMNGASGIPGLPWDTVQSLGNPAQWDNPNHQIDVGLEYIKGRHKDPDSALYHMQRNGWY